MAVLSAAGLPSPCRSPCHSSTPAKRRSVQYALRNDRPRHFVVRGRQVTPPPAAQWARCGRAHQAFSWFVADRVSEGQFGVCMACRRIDGRMLGRGCSAWRRSWGRGSESGMAGEAPSAPADSHSAVGVQRELPAFLVGQVVAEPAERHKVCQFGGAAVFTPDDVMKIGHLGPGDHNLESDSLDRGSGGPPDRGGYRVVGVPDRQWGVAVGQDRNSFGVTRQHLDPGGGLASAATGQAP